MSTVYCGVMSKKITLARFLLLQAIEGRTQKDVADEIGISAPELNHLIKGRRVTPSIETAIKLRDGLEIPIDAWLRPA